MRPTSGGVWNMQKHEYEAQLISFAQEDSQQFLSAILKRSVNQLSRTQQKRDRWSVALPNIAFVYSTF